MQFWGSIFWYLFCWWLLLRDLGLWRNWSRCWFHCTLGCIYRCAFGFFGFFRTTYGCLNSFDSLLLSLFWCQLLRCLAFWIDIELTCPVILLLEITFRWCWLFSFCRWLINLLLFLLWNMLRLFTFLDFFRLFLLYLWLRLLLNFFLD